jgi:hypothetical protein
MIAGTGRLRRCHLKETGMNDSTTPKDGDFASWIDEKSEALKFELGEKFPVPPTEIHSPSVHPETGRQKLEEVLLEHEQPTAELLEEIQALESAPPLSDEELARQALAAGGDDGDAGTPE